MNIMKHMEKEQLIDNILVKNIIVTVVEMLLKNLIIVMNLNLNFNHSINPKLRLKKK